MTLDANQAIAASKPLLQKAVAMLHAAWEKNPGDWKTGWKLAERLRQLGSLQGARQVYSEILRVNPGCREADYLMRVLTGCDVAYYPKLHFTPTPFIYQENFLPAATLDLLWQCVMKNKGQFCPSKVVGGHVPGARNSRVIQGDKLSSVAANVIRAVLKELSASMSRLGMMSFEIKRKELELVSYSDGEYYHAHADIGPKGYTSDRAITFVIYFFREPKQVEGGDLVLYDAAQEQPCSLSRYTRIVPQNNSLLIFPSAAYHQVTQVHSPDPRLEFGRFSVNGWLHH